MLQANSWSQCTCKYDVIMMNFGAYQLKSNRDLTVLKKNNLHFVNEHKIMNKYCIARLSNNGNLCNIQFINADLKILCKVIVAHFRLWRNIYVAYKSQYCKDIHLIYHGRLLKINCRSIQIFFKKVLWSSKFSQK